MNKIIIGIDPGSLGGIAVLDGDGRVLEATKMPDTPQDIFNCLKGYKAKAVDEQRQIICYIEAVGYGRPGQSLKATATFARHCGQLDMALLAIGIPTNTVTPQKWEKAYQLGNSKGFTKTQWKNKLKAKAQQLFPETKMTLAISDALLIAEYGRKIEIGK